MSAQATALLHCGAAGGADVYLDNGDRLPFFGEKATRQKAIGILLIIIGVVLVITI